MPRLTQAGQIIIGPNTEPRSLSDIINFTQKSSLTESQITTTQTFPNPKWEQAMRTFNIYLGTSQIYNESCAIYACPGGLPTPKDVQTAGIFTGREPSSVRVACVISFPPRPCPLVYAANQAANNVSVIDPSTNTVLTTVRVGVSPLGVAFNPTTLLAYVANSGSNSVSVIDPSTNTVVKNVTVGTRPVGVAVNPSTNLVYVTNFGSNSTTVINGATNTVLTTISSGFMQPNGVDVDTSTNRTYVTNSAGNYVSVISGSVISGIKVIQNVTVGAGPWSVAVNPVTKLVYVTRSPAFATGFVSVINATTVPASVIANLSVGSSPFSVAVNPSNNRVYVANWGPFYNPFGCCNFLVSVIDGASNTILRSFATDFFGSSHFVCFAQGLPCPGLGQGLSVDPTTNLVYLVAQGSVSVIGQRPEIREVCLNAPANCLVVSSTGTILNPINSVNLVAVSFHSNTTKTGTQMTLTVFCDSNAGGPKGCSSFYVDGNVWGPGQTDLSKSPFIIQNAEPYFYLQFHWWDFQNSRIVAWGTWWYGATPTPNWFWGVYWWWRTYVNYYIGIPYIPWWWWTWHWMYWRYWAWWGTAFQT